MADEELKKFEKLAQDWWNVNGSMKMLHQLNTVRLNTLTKNFSLEKKVTRLWMWRRNFN